MCIGEANKWVDGVLVQNSRNRRLAKTESVLSEGRGSQEETYKSERTHPGSVNRDRENLP